MLYIWMPEHDATWYWSNGDAWQSVAGLEQLIQQLQQHVQRYPNEQSAVLLFPTQQAQLLKHSMAKVQYKQLNDSVQYLLEDVMTEPIDQIVVRHRFVAPNQLYLMGVAQHAIETWRHALGLLPVKIVAMLPDFLALPSPEQLTFVAPVTAADSSNSNSVLQTSPDSVPDTTFGAEQHSQHLVLAAVAGRLIARQGLLQGQSIDDLAVFLSFLPSHTVIAASGLDAVQYDLIKQFGFTVQTFDYQFNPQGLTAQHAFNVLPKQKNQRRWSGYWTACIGLLLALFTVQLSYDLWRYYKLKSVADLTAEQAVNQYKTWFGSNNRVTEQNLRSQFESQLKSSQTANHQALDLLSRVGPILMQRQMLAQQVNYDNSVLSLQLRAKSNDELQSLTQQLNQQGFKAQLGSVQADGANVLGLLKVE